MRLMTMTVFLSLTALTAGAQPVTIDGRFNPGEWLTASQYGFSVAQPDGTSIPVQLFITNDERNVYACVRVRETALSAESMSIAFDTPRPGAAIGAGETSVLVTVDRSSYHTRWYRDYRILNGRACNVSRRCAPSEGRAGTLMLGSAAVQNDGAWTTYEVGRPLFALEEITRFVVQMRMNGADSYYPGPDQMALQTYIVQ